MSSVKTWQTKEDVMRDLAKLSGRRNARVGNLDNGYLLQGNKPPPVKLEAEDEEIRLQFGDALHPGKDIFCENTPPDLQGIAYYLRIAKESDGEGDNEDLTNIGQGSNCVIAISKGSKLNPNVKEFIPKGAFSSHSFSDVSENCTKSMKTDVAQTTDVAKSDESEVDQALDVAKSGDDFNVDQTTYVAKDDTSNVAQTTDAPKDDENKDLAAILKKKISDASKSNSFELKKQRNLAITTLLRLYASDNKATPKPSGALKLMTPDYFENKSSTDIDQVEKRKIMPISTSTSTSPGPNSVPSTATSTNDVRSEPAIPTQVVTESPKQVNSRAKVDPVIKKSIEKVNQWLDPPTPKSPAICRGPVLYKKKEPPLPPKLPAVQVPEDRTAPKPVQPSQYQPSNYAKDLEKKYMERSKNKKENKKRNLWTDLHVILKEKDAIVRKRLAEQQTSENIRDPDVSIQ